MGPAHYVVACEAVLPDLASGRTDKYTGLQQRDADLAVELGCVVLVPAMCRPYHYTGVSPSSLSLGHSGYELAAEVGDVWNHASPYRVNMGYGQPVSVSSDSSLVASNSSDSLAGVLTGVAARVG